MEPISASAYKLDLAGDEVEIGDVSKTYFRPHVKLTRWAAETSLSLYLPDTVIGSFLS